MCSKYINVIKLSFIYVEGWVVNVYVWRFLSSYSPCTDKCIIILSTRRDNTELRVVFLLFDRQTINQIMTNNSAV